MRYELGGQAVRLGEGIDLSARYLAQQGQDGGKYLQIEGALEVVFQHIAFHHQFEERFVFATALRRRVCRERFVPVFHKEGVYGKVSAGSAFRARQGGDSDQKQQQDWHKPARNRMNVPHASPSFQRVS